MMMNTEEVVVEVETEEEGLVAGDTMVGRVEGVEGTEETGTMIAGTMDAATMVLFNHSWEVWAEADPWPITSPSLTSTPPAPR